MEKKRPPYPINSTLKSTFSFQDRRTNSCYYTAMHSALYATTKFCFDSTSVQSSSACGPTDCYSDEKEKKEYHFPPVCSLMILMVEFHYHSSAPSQVYYQALKFTSVGTMLSANCYFGALPFNPGAARFHLLQPGWCSPPLVSLNNTHSCQQCQAAATKGCPRCSRFSSSCSSAHARCRQTSSDWTCCTILDAVRDYWGEPWSHSLRSPTSGSSRWWFLLLVSWAEPSRPGLQSVALEEKYPPITLSFIPQAYPGVPQGYPGVPQVYPGVLQEYTGVPQVFFRCTQVSLMCSSGVHWCSSGLPWSYPGVPLVFLWCTQVFLRCTQMFLRCRLGEQGVSREYFPPPANPWLPNGFYLRQDQNQSKHNKHRNPGDVCPTAAQ